MASPSFVELLQYLGQKQNTNAFLITCCLVLSDLSYITLQCIRQFWTNFPYNNSVKAESVPQTSIIDWGTLYTTGSWCGQLVLILMGTSRVCLTLSHTKLNETQKYFISIGMCPVFNVHLWKHNACIHHVFILQKCVARRCNALPQVHLKQTCCHMRVIVFWKKKFWLSFQVVYFGNMTIEQSLQIVCMGPTSLITCTQKRHILQTQNNFIEVSLALITWSQNNLVKWS